MGSSVSLASTIPVTEAKISVTPVVRVAIANPEEEDKSTEEDRGANILIGEDEENRKSTEQEDIHVQKDRIFKTLSEAITKLNQLPNLRDEDGNWVEDLRQCLREFLIQLSAIRNMGQLAYGVIGNYKREAGHLICTSKTVNILCRVVKDGWKIYFEDKEVTLTRGHLQVIQLALQNLVSFSDSSTQVKCEIAKDGELLMILTKILKGFNSAVREGGKETDVTDLVSGSLLILCNISQVDENIKLLRCLNNVKIIALYLDTKFRFVALTYLANIMNEDESANLQGMDHAIETIKFLSDLLSGALKDPLHKYKDDCEIVWSAQECAQTIRVLARNDQSKRMLTEVGCLPHLVELARCGTVEEQKEAVGAIWALAFDEENQNIILEDKTLSIVSMLVDLTKSLNSVRKAAEGTLWILRNKLKQNEAYKDLDFLMETNVPDSADARNNSHGEADEHRKKGHVMISYNRNHREQAKWIRDQLVSKGYPVWMDIGNMGGSTSQTMAEAIESAHVFLFCYSEGYKNSSNCRQEADYASSLGERVQMIPILMEEGYKADGWLGFYVGRNYFYDFSGKYRREEKLQELLTKLDKCYQKLQETNAVTVNSSSRARTSIPDLRKWTSNDMNNWIKKYNLPREEFEQFTGRDLAALIIMRKEAPECFYRRIKKEFKIKRLSTTDLFIEALEDLTM